MLIILILACVVWWQRVQIEDLRWWNKYLAERRDAEAEFNRQLLDRIIGDDDSDDSDEAEDWPSEIKA